MASLLTSIYLLSLKQSETVHSVDIDCIKYSDKEFCTQGLYNDAKREYFRSRCAKCRCAKCKLWRMKKNLKCTEKLFRTYKCLFISWDMKQPLVIFFSNGSIVNMEFNDENNTLLKIQIDNNLCGKFLPSRIVDVIICQNCIFLTYSEPKLTFIHINQGSPSLSAKLFGRKKGKVLGFESKVINIDLIGPTSKSLERKLSLNSHKDCLLIWWKFSDDGVWPWTPVTYSSDRINMLVYTLNGCCIEILCTVKVHGELIHANFSSQYSNQILTLEEIKNGQEINVNVCVHEIIRGQCQLVFMAKLPLRGNLISFDWSSTEDKLLASDSDKFLLIYDLRKKSTIATNLSFLPKQISWHPESCIALVVGTNSQVQCFDAALTCVKLKMSYKSYTEHDVLELNCHFAQQHSVQKILWQKSLLNNTCLFLLDSEQSSFILFKLSLGCITMNHLTAVELISQYLKCNCIDEAILLLRSLSWCHESEIVFQCLCKITNFLFRKTLNSRTQAGLELALGTYYNLVDTLPKKVIKMYQHKVHHIARCFFHLLLRNHQFRKAFLLAVDLESQDLFLDLYHVAKQKGENILALVAFHKAEELDDSQSSYTDMSSVSDSNTDPSSSSNNEEASSEDLNVQNSFSVETYGGGNSSNHHYWPDVSEESKLDDAWFCSVENNLQGYSVTTDHQSKSNYLDLTHCNYTDSLCQDSENAVYTVSYPMTYAYPSNRVQDEHTLKKRSLPQLPSVSSECCIKEPYETCGPSTVIKVQSSDGPYQPKKFEESEIGYVTANKSLEDDNEEVEDTRIKLVHFGII